MVTKDYKSKGYTLLELIITIAIISIIVSISIPKLKLSTYNLKPSGTKLCQEIRNIRYISMTDNTLYNIILNKDSYYIRKGTKIIKNATLDKNLILSDNFNDLASEYSTVQFNHNGAPMYAGTIKIRDKNSGKYIEITIVPVTGRVLLKNDIFKE